MGARMFVIAVVLALGLEIQQPSCQGTQVLWPKGRYALPAAIEGCPSSQGFQWTTGVVYQDLEDHANKNDICPDSSHLAAALINGSDIAQQFCVKNDTQRNIERPRWPRGKYCIFKKGDTCPRLLREGSVTFYNENQNESKNRNHHSGEVPAGTYGKDTTLEFCCAVDGRESSVVSLPIDKPFFLMQYFKASQCQEVKGAFYQLEVVTYDTENEMTSGLPQGESPAGLYELPNPKINYCYYQACKWELTRSRGHFTSPYYPKPYQNKAECEWNIRAPTNYSVEITFDDFQLETTSYCHSHATPCVCDFVRILEKAPDDHVVRSGTYCMDKRYLPLGTIYLSVNHVTVLFRSDSTRAGRGFNATYVIRPPGNESTTRIPATEATETTAVPNNYTPTVQSTRPTQHVTSGTIRSTTQMVTACPNTTCNGTEGRTGHVQKSKQTMLVVALVVPLVAMVTCLVALVGVWYLKRRQKIKLQTDQLKVHYGHDNEAFGEAPATVEIYGESCEMDKSYEKQDLWRREPLAEEIQETVSRDIRRGMPTRRNKSLDDDVFEAAPKAKSSDNPLYVSDENVEETVKDRRTQSMTSLYAVSELSLQDNCSEDDSNNVYETPDVNLPPTKRRNRSVESINSLYAVSDIRDSIDVEETLETTDNPLYERLI